MFASNIHSNIILFPTILFSFPLVQDTHLEIQACMDLYLSVYVSLPWKFSKSVPRQNESFEKLITQICATELNIHWYWGTFHQYVEMNGTFIFMPYVSTYVIVKSTPVTHYLKKDRKITGYDSYSCLMSTHEVTAVIITYATCGEKVNRETREDGESG